ncbi:DUF1838 domain-containing protein [Candidatus Synechococcus calcipolaris G9]|uniref:DUF1838 domain-containing protein n=1 Tax=Candidatus Synechococcus calcipolaris G9 TaxID=1497997 RepID=A0ABT6EXG0_9SYNE|nr:DUF1838 domain-containing protein [Candidatus Synechococcus calcipolaris]MDG2990184.1 DUF1838 domain-containing protein [Candidatus Synechococcus calcipolaris G9]
MTSEAALPLGESRQEMLPARDWVRVRADLSSKTTYIVWQGAIYSFEPGQPRQHLFNIVGMSAARCLAQAEDTWDFMSRELTFYLDPATNAILHQWLNPWLGESVPVVHVANDPVQGCFRRPLPAQVSSTTTTFRFDLFPSYANPLADDPRFADYSPQPLYQAVELFKLAIATADLEDPTPSAIAQVSLAWSRIGPWLPWMKMGARPGQLIYSATGQKVLKINDLPQLLQEQIRDRLPQYQEAPSQLNDGEDMTSWLYFRQHFEAYLRGDIFPIGETQSS